MGLFDVLADVLSGKETARQKPASTKPNLIQVQKTLSQMGDHAVGLWGKQIKIESTLFLSDKKKEFQGDAYIEQLEKNAIYAVEFNSRVLSALITFMITRVQLDDDFILRHMKNGRSLALEHVPYHLEYLNHGCNQCDIHAEHQKYAGLKAIKDSGDTERYKDEIEFWCTYYRAMHSVTIAYLDYFSSHKNLFNGYYHFDESTLYDHLVASIKWHSDHCIDNVKLSL